MDASNQVHVGSLDALERLASGLANSSSRIMELCDQALRDSQARLEIADALFEDAIRHAEVAVNEVSTCERDVAECEASCETGRGDSDDDNGESFDGDDSDRVEALEALDSAREALAQAEAGVESAREGRMRAMRAHEAVSASALHTRDHLENHLCAGVAFLNQKIGQLREYLLGHPELADRSRVGALAFTGAWLGWCPAGGAVIKHSMLAGRFSLPPASLGELARRWAREDPSLARQIGTLRERYARAGSQEELDAVRMVSRRGASGRLGELIAENALGPMARSIELQRRTNTDDNAHVTITDIVLRGMRIPINVGKLQIPSGADASVEVKCGAPAYLKQQLIHMQRQVAGHHNEHASFCFLSRDFSKLDRTAKREIARTLGKKRSKIFALLPEKATLDSLVWKQITDT